MSIVPTLEELHRRLVRRSESSAPQGPRPRLRARFGYATSSDYYHVLIDSMVQPGCRWLDVGGGKTVFPDQPRWAAEIAGRCARLVAVDPSPTVRQNTIAHECVSCMIEDYHASEVFDLATLRMVAEHIEHPARVGAALAKLIRPGGHVVVLTPYKWAPASIAAALVPNSLHKHFTRAMAGRLEEDTFPTRYRLNTRRALRDAFESVGFREAAFWQLADLSVLQRSHAVFVSQLMLWRLFSKVGVTYPENVLLAVYQRHA